MLFVEKLSRRTHREIVRRNLNAVRLLLIGVLFIIIGILSGNHMPAIASAIISTIGSFAVWEASAIWIETMPVLRKRERVQICLQVRDSDLQGVKENDKT